MFFGGNSGRLTALALHFLPASLAAGEKRLPPVVPTLPVMDISPFTLNTWPAQDFEFVISGSETPAGLH